MKAMNFKELISVFESTEEIISASEELTASTLESIKGTRIYGIGFHASERPLKCEENNVQVIEGTTLDTARAHGEGRVAVLNFANPFEPGGGVKRGARAQEECICRCSNLYNVLATDDLIRDYYKWHELCTTNSFSDKVIYSPGIRVIRSDDYELLDSPYTVDVITAAAPYNMCVFDRKFLMQTYESRITNILESAIDNGVDTVVLGAFGCGAFRNLPKNVAEAFKEVLITRRYYKFFKKVIFAIIDSSSFDRNLAVFKECFGSI